MGNRAPSARASSACATGHAMASRSASRTSSAPARTALAEDATGTGRRSSQSMVVVVDEDDARGGGDANARRVRRVHAVNDDRRGEVV